MSQFTEQYEVLRSKIILLLQSRARHIQINLDLEAQLNANGSEKDTLIDSLRRQLEAQVEVVARVSTDRTDLQAQLVAAQSDDAATAEAQQATAIALSESNTQIDQLLASKVILESRVAEAEVAIAASNEATTAAVNAAAEARAVLAEGEADLAALIELADSEPETPAA
jgi:ribose 1,5-bisphosphokinase PhnN